MKVSQAGDFHLQYSFHNAENGWSVLKLSLFNEPHKLAVVIHQAKIFPGRPPSVI